MEVYGTQCEDFPSNLQIFSQQIGLDGTRYFTQRECLTLNTYSLKAL